MIEGEVNSAYEAIIPLSLQGPAGRTQQIEAVIDTGFTGFLMLPPSLVAELGLVFRGISEATLADGSGVSFDAYDATALWEGDPRVVLITQSRTMETQQEADLRHGESASSHHTSPKLLSSVHPAE